MPFTRYRPRLFTRHTGRTSRLDWKLLAVIAAVVGIVGAIVFTLIIQSVIGSIG